MSDKKKSGDLKQPFTVTQTGQMMNAAGQIVTVNPMPGGAGRKWIKLWVNPWLDGTTRWQTTGAQRAFWIDLLAEAGRGRFPGFVAAGVDAGQIVGYPLYWYRAKQAEEEEFDVQATLALFERTGKIRLIITSKEPFLVAIEILNWRLYQSDLDNQAERARKYREGKKKARE
jgi:hypothetical protein